jgi:hypothetical protein
MAKLAKLCDDSENKDTPKLPYLSPDEEPSVENFLTTLVLILRVLGLNIFETRSGSRTETPDKMSHSKMFFLKAKDVKARAYRDSDAFVVLADSQAVLREAPHVSEGIIAHRKSLQDNGVLILNAEKDRFLFSQNYRFTSPTAAAQAVLGGSYDGRLLWKDEHSKSIKVLEAEAAGATENMTR